MTFQEARDPLLLSLMPKAIFFLITSKHDVNRLDLVIKTQLLHWGKPVETGFEPEISIRGTRECLAQSFFSCCVQWHG